MNYPNTILKLLAFTVIFSTQSIAAKPIKIVAIGDSITQGHGNRNDDGGFSWRYWFWKKLVKEGQDIDMVGSLNRTEAEELSIQPPKVLDKNFDPDHEGHWGWKTDEIISGRNTPYSTNGTGRLSEWLEDYTPDVAIIILGLNDIFREKESTPDQFAKDHRDEMRAIVETLQQDNPKVFVIVCSIPNTAGGTSKKSEPANELLAAEAKSWSTDISKVIYADINRQYNATREKQTWDGTHPNAKGEQILAKNIYRAFRKFNL